MVSPMATPMASEAADRVPAVVTRTGRRRQFSEEDKRLIVDAAIGDGIERECGRRLAVKQVASSFC
jgi:hypothetical protein